MSNPERELVGWMDEIRSARQNQAEVRSLLWKRYPVYAAALDSSVRDLVPAPVVVGFGALDFEHGATGQEGETDD